ncbi:MAG TPA: flagellar motor switch protein FliG [Stellaceae bacterium]|nr:flagellar motor switch protein FliG [Stellaceae bacterium]
MASPEASSGELTDIEKAAILMTLVGQKEAAEVIKHLQPREINRLASAMARLPKVAKGSAETVFHEFASMMTEPNAGFGAEEYLRGALTEALGEKRAAGLLERLMHGGDSAGIEAVKWQDPRAVAEMIEGEHPQIVAMILAYMEAEQAIEVVRHLPDELVEQVVPRLATLDMIPPTAIQELNEALQDQLVGDTPQVRLNNVGGVKAAAEILNHFDGSRSQNMLNAIKQFDAELAQRIYDNMFVFADLVDVEDRSLQSLLREIDQNLLVPALKGVDENLREKIFRNMSQRQADSLKEEIETKGPMRLSEVEAAQRQILAAAQALEAEGKINLRVNTQDLVA